MNYTYHILFILLLAGFITITILTRNSRPQDNMWTCIAKLFRIIKKMVPLGPNKNETCDKLVSDKMMVNGKTSVKDRREKNSDETEEQNTEEAANKKHKRKRNRHYQKGSIRNDQKKEIPKNDKEGRGNRNNDRKNNNTSKKDRHKGGQEDVSSNVMPAAKNMQGSKNKRKKKKRRHAARNCDGNSEGKKQETKS